MSSDTTRREFLANAFGFLAGPTTAAAVVGGAAYFGVNKVSLPGEIDRLSEAFPEASKAQIEETAADISDSRAKTVGSLSAGAILGAAVTAKLTRD